MLAFIFVAMATCKHTETISSADHESPRNSKKQERPHQFGDFRDEIPAEFGKLASADILPNAKPAMIYEIRMVENVAQARFAGLGLVIETGTDLFQIITAGHIIMSNERTGTNAYALRLLRTNDHNFFGYIGEMTYRSNGHPEDDLIIANVSPVPVYIAPFRTMNRREAIKAILASPIAIGNKEITSLRSLITGEYIPAIGYGAAIPADLKPIGTNAATHDNLYALETKRPLVIIDLKCPSGFSGYPFIDGHGRLFTLQGGDDPSSNELATIRPGFIELFHREPKGITMLAGPIDLLFTQ